MGKNTELINIYLKIHQKRELSFEDLEYLARFDPECFEKTCHNVVYNLPQAGPVILPPKPEEKKISFVPEKEEKEERRFFVEKILENLRHLERRQLPHVEFDARRVKELLGNLYMELLFPHNDKESSFYTDFENTRSTFDKKA